MREKKRKPYYLCYVGLNLKVCAALVCRGGDDGAMSVDQMTEFINNKQRDPRLNEILYPPLRPAQTHTLMERYQHDKAQLERGEHTIPVLAYIYFVNYYLCVSAN